MTATASVRAAQVTSLITAADALIIARERFSNLSCGGILPKRALGEPVDLDDIDVALAFLAQCRKTKVPSCHSFDLRRAVDVQLGAVIAAATALGFDVHSWLDITTFVPHCMTNVDPDDVRRVANLSR
jgi:hypothetical protein